MQVDDTARIGLNQEVGYQWQKPCQHDEVYLVFVHQRHHKCLVIQLCLGHYSCCYTQVLSSDQCVCLSFVADDKLAIYIVTAFKVTYQVLTVGAAARHEYRDISFHLFMFIAAKVRISEENTKGKHVFFFDF